MSISNDVTELTKVGIVADVPIDCDMPCYDVGEIVVRCGAELVVAPHVEYAVELNETTFADFVLTPSAALITRCAGVFTIIIQRRTDLTSDFTDTDAFLRQKVVKETDRLLMRIQELNTRATRFARWKLGTAVGSTVLPEPDDGKALVWADDELTNGQLVSLGDLMLTGPFVDGAVLRMNGVSGLAIQGSLVTIDVDGNTAGVQGITFTSEINSIIEKPGSVLGIPSLRMDGRLGLAVDVGPARRLHSRAGDIAANVTGDTNTAMFAEAIDRSSVRTGQVKGLHGKVIVGSAANEGHEDFAVLAELEVSKKVTAAGDTHCAFYGVANKYGAARAFAMGLVCNDLTVYRTPASTSASTGAEVALCAYGEDDPITPVREVFRVAVRALDEDDIDIETIALGATTVVETALPHGLVDDTHVQINGIVGPDPLNDTEYIVDNRGGGGTINIASIAVVPSEDTTGQVTGIITVTTDGPHGRAEKSNVWIDGVTGMDDINGRLYMAVSVTANTFELDHINNKYPYPRINGLDYAPATPMTGVVSWFTTFEIRTKAGAAVNSTGFDPYVSSGKVWRIGKALGVHIRPNVQSWSRYGTAMLIDDARDGWLNQLSALDQLIELNTKAPKTIKFAGAPGLAMDLTEVATAGPMIALGATHTISIGGNQVLGPRGAAIANATDAASVITQLNLWLAQARATGTIAP